MNGCFKFLFCIKMLELLPGLLSRGYLLENSKNEFKGTEFRPGFPLIVERQGFIKCLSESLKLQESY